VSTRRMDKLVETLGITSLSKSQVSVIGQRTRHCRGSLPHPALGCRPVHLHGRRWPWCSKSARPDGWSS